MERLFIIKSVYDYWALARARPSKDGVSVLQPASPPAETVIVPELLPVAVAVSVQ